MRKAIPPLPNYASMAWCSVKIGTGTTLPFTLNYITFTTRNRTLKWFCTRKFNTKTMEQYI